MKNKIILFNVVLGLIFVISLIAFILLLKLSFLWGEMQLHTFLWAPGADLEKAKEFQNSFYVVVTGSVFTGITTLLSGLALLVIDYKFLKHKPI